MACSTGRRDGRAKRKIDIVESPTRTVDLGSTASFDVTDQLSSNTSVGLQYYATDTRDYSLEGQNFATIALTTIDAAASTESSESFVENATVGVYVQQQFGWEDRLFLTGAVRLDDNSAFGENFDAAVYPKVSGSWVMSEEEFWTLDLLSAFRLRGAWGQAGQQPDAFAAQRLYGSVPGPGDQPILVPTAFGNPDLGPEKGSELELGFDAGLFDDRMSFAFTYYTRKTTDAIVERPVFPSIGFPGVQLQNIGQVSNWGIEALLDVQLLTQDPLRWDVTLAFSTNENRIDDMGDVARIPVSRGTSHVEGFPLNSLFDFRVLSAEFVSGQSGAVTNLMCDGGTGLNGWEQGGAAVPCPEADVVYFGNTEPKWTAHFGSTLDSVQQPAALCQRGRSRRLLHASRLHRVGAKPEYEGLRLTGRSIPCGVHCPYAGAG